MTPRERTTAEAQLERVLHILPAAARGDGVSLNDLARDLGVTPKQVFDDLSETTARSFHHPGGTVDPFTILFTRRQVRVDAREHFRRPARLNDREALALGLGLRVLASDVSEERRREMLDLAARLEAALCAPDYSPSGTAVSEDGVEYEGHELGLSMGADRFRGLFADAIERRLTCLFAYLKAGGEAPEVRRVAAYRLIYASGRWYVAGFDVERAGLRFFRLDRVLAADVLDEAAPPPPEGFEAWVAGAPYRAEKEEEVVVSYDASVAPWVREAVPVEAGEDGSVVVRHRVADRRWIVRHVLQYGGAAVAKTPRVVREAVARAADFALSSAPHVEMD
jgi:proteasome accessory factor C